MTQAEGMKGLRSRAITFQVFFELACTLRDGASLGSKSDIPKSICCCRYRLVLQSLR